jgi:6-phospho-3-hexuloisomerase
MSFFMGRGHTGLVLEMFAMRLTQVRRQAHFIDSPTTPSVQPREVFLVTPTREKTESLHLAAEQVSFVREKIAVISSGPEEKLIQHADVRLHLPGGDKFSGDLQHYRIPLASISGRAFFSF